ncbi:MAG TPA: Ig-like domain-containing protein, partial [Nitrolancea sp.]|nr:Ig-like domain-containing protein [Nitrolancea sp.]
RGSALLLILLLALGAWSAPAGAANTNILTLTPSSQHALVGGSAQVTATLRTQGGVPVPSAFIQLSISGTMQETMLETTDSQGQATFSYTGVSAGVDMLVVSSATAQFGATATITWQATGQASSITLSPASLTAAVGTAPAFTATLVDPNGVPVPGVAVSFSVSGVNSGSSTVLTNSQGQAVFSYLGTRIGQDTLTATAPGGVTPAAATIHWTNALQITITPSALTAVAGTAQTFVATVTDGIGNPIPLATVTFSASGANSASGTDVSDSNGEASFTYTGNHVGVDSLTATTPGAPVAALATISWVSTAAISLSPTNVSAAVGTAQTITATVVDLDGDPIPGVVVSFSVSGVNAASGSVTTDSDGEASFSYTGAHVGTDTVSATTPGVQVAATATIVWSVAESVSISPETVTVATGVVQSFTATVVDVDGDPVPGEVVMFTVTGANPTSGTATTNSDGQASFSYNGTASGTDTVTAFVDLNNNGSAGSNEPAAKAVVTRTSASLALSVSSASATTGASVTVTATLSQTAGALAGRTIRFTVSGANPTSGSGTTNSSGQATFSYAGATAGSDAITAYADLNANGSRDAGEPSATAAVAWSTPPKPALPAAEPAAPQAGCTYFAVTRHNLCAGFASYWNKFGGLAVYGYPLTEEFVENGFTVQYFERARFEWHPGAWPERYDVELGLLGNMVTVGRGGEPPFQRAASKPDTSCVYYAETGHNLCGGFGDFWQQFGGLAVYGFPISEEFQEKNADTGKTYTVQYFQRGRFEWHPGEDPQHFDVMLGRLGAEILNATYGTKF